MQLGYLSLRLTDIGAFLRKLSRMMVIFAMLGLLYSCGSGGDAGSDDPAAAAASTDNAHDDDDDNKNTAVITRPDDEVLGDFSFAEIFYNVSAGDSVDVTIKIAGKAPEKDFSIILQTQVDGVAMPNTTLDFKAGDKEHVYKFDSRPYVVGATVKLGLQGLPEGYTYAADAAAVIVIEGNELRFASDAYAVKIGESGNVGIEISTALATDINIPVSVLDGNGIRISIVTMPAGQTSAVLTYNISSSSIAGVAVFSFTAIPDGLVAGSPSEARLTVLENDSLAPITVNFARGDYSVIAGKEVDIDVILTTTLDLVGPITIFYDYTADGSVGTTPYSIVFDAVSDSSPTQLIQSITYTAGESGGGTYKIGDLSSVRGKTSDGTTYEITKGNPSEAVVKVATSNISFKEATATVNYGDDAEFTIQLSAPAPEAFDAPVQVTSRKADGTIETTDVSVAFIAGQQEVKSIFPTSDRKPGSNVVFSFAGLNLTDYTVASGGINTKIVTVEANLLSFKTGQPVNVEVELGGDYATAFSRTDTSAGSSTFPLLRTDVKGGVAGAATPVTASFSGGPNASARFFFPSHRYEVGDEVHIDIDIPALAGHGFAAGYDTTTRVIKIIAPKNVIHFPKTIHNINLGDAVDIPIELEQTRTSALDVTIIKTTTDLDDNIVTAETGTLTVSFAAGSKTPTAATALRHDSALSTTLGTVSYAIDPTSLPADVKPHDYFATAFVNISDQRLNFEQAEYIVSPGDELEVTLELGAITTAEATVSVFITKTSPDGTVSAKETVTQIVTVGTDTVTVSSGNANAYKRDDENGTIIKYEINEAGLNGVVLGDVTTAIVNVVAYGLEFAAADYYVRDGDSVDVGVVLSSLPHKPIDITVAYDYGFLWGIGNGTFPAITFSPSDTPEADGTIVKKINIPASFITKYGRDQLWLNFSFPPSNLFRNDVIRNDFSTIYQAILERVDSSVDFEHATYDVAVGSTAPIYLELYSPATEQMTMKVNKTGTTDVIDVVFEAGEQRKSFDHVASSTAGETVSYEIDVTASRNAGANVTAGTIINTSVTSVVGNSVQFAPTVYDVVAGGTVDLTLTLDTAVPADATAAWDVPLIVTPIIGGVEGTSTNQTVSFSANTDSKTFTYLADSTLSAGDTVRYEIGTGLLNGLVAGTDNTAIITILGKPAVSFGAASYNVAEGGTVDIEVILSRAPDTNTIVGVGFGHADNGHSFSPNLPEFTFSPTDTPETNGTIVKTFTVSADDVLTAIGNGSDGLIYFWRHPLDITGGTHYEATIAVTAVDKAVSFDHASYDVAVGSTTPIYLELASVSGVQRTVKVNKTGTADVIDVVFEVGEQRKSFDHVTSSTTGETVSYEIDITASQAAGASVTAGSTISTSITSVTANEVEFSATTYDVVYDSTVDLTLKLATPVPTSATAPWEVPVTFTEIDDGTELPSVTQTASFAPGQDTATVTYTHHNRLYLDETVRYEIGAVLLNGVIAGTDKTATITVIPANIISFGAASYEVEEGGSVDIEVILDKAPTESLGNLRLYAFGSSDELTGEISFDSGYTTRADGTIVKTATIAASDIGAVGDSKRVGLLGYFLSLKIGDNIPAEVTVVAAVANNDVSFDSAAYDVEVGDIAKLKVNLENSAVGNVDIPIQLSTAGGTLSDAGTLTIADGQSSGVFEYNTSTSGEVAGTNLTFSLGTLPAGFTEASGADAITETTVTIINITTVEFEESSLTLRSIELKTIKIKMPESAPLDKSFSVWTYRGDGSRFFSGEIYVTAGDTEASFELTASSIIANDYKLKLGDDLGTGFTYKVGGNKELNLTIVATEVSFAKDKYPLLTETSVDVTVEIDVARGRNTTIPLLVNNGSGTSSAGDVTIPAGDTSAIFTYNAPVAQPTFFNPNPGYITGDYTLSFDTANWSSGLTAGDTAETTLEIFEYNVSFVEDTNVVDGSYVDIPVVLSTSPLTSLPIPYTIGGGASRTVDFEPTDVAETDGTIIKTIRINSSDIGSLNDGKEIKFGNLPAGVIVGSVDDVYVAVSSNIVSFSTRNYNFRTGLPLNITVRLAADAVVERIIPIKITNDDDNSSLGTVNAVFAIGTKETTFAYDSSLSTGEISYSFDDSTLPSGISQPDNTITPTPGVYWITSVATGNDGVGFGAGIYYTLANEPANVDVILYDKPDTELTVPILLGGEAYATVTFGPTDATNSSGWVEKIVQIDVSDIGVSGESKLLTFGTPPVGVTVDTTNALLYAETTVEFATRYISFFDEKINVRAGDTANIELYRTFRANNNFSIPINISIDGGTPTSADNAIIPHSSFDEKAVSVSRNTATESDPVGRVITYSFGELPEGLSFDTDAIKETEVTVTNSDFEFEKASYPVVAGSTVPIKFTLDSPATIAGYIDINKKVGSTETYLGTAIAIAGTSEAIFDYPIPADATDHMLTVNESFLSAGYTLKSDGKREAQITIVDILTFAEQTIEATAGTTIPVKLTLTKPATAELSVPLIVTDTGGTVTALGNAVFAVNTKEVTIDYVVPATAGEYTISVDETIFTFPADVVAGLPNNTVVTATVSRTLSFTTATSADAYINEDVSLAVAINPAFTERTEIVVRRSANGATLSHVTAVFEANATAGTITDTAPAIEIGASSVKDRTITYRFHTTHHTFPNHTLVDSGKDETQYTAKGYSYEFANLATSVATTIDQTSSASVGDVIYIPILLDAPLKAPADIIIARTSGGLVAIEHTMDDIGNAEQRVPFTLTDTASTYSLEFKISDTSVQKGMVVSSSALRDRYNYDIVNGNVISFDNASHGDITVEEAQDIALSVDIAFGADTTIPLTRTITSLDGATTYSTDAVTATFLGSSLTASVDAGTVDATTVPSVKDRKVTFSFNTTHADWAGLNSTIGATNESTYNTLGYEYRFAAEPIPAGSFSSTGYHEGRIANGSTIQLPFTLGAPLNKAITLELQVLTSKDGGGYDIETITMADFGVVGQANQTFPYTLPTTKTAQYDMLFVLVATDLMNIGGGAADPAKVYQYRIDPFVVHPISFDNATYPDVYVGDAQPITLTLETAFPVETKVPLVKNIYGVFINYNVTATFAANSLTASVDAEYIAAPHLKNRTVTYRFDTSHADWIAKDLTAPPLAQSNYFVIGYDYYFPNETGGGTHEALSAQAAAVIDLPFTLTTPLKAQTNFTMEVRHDAGGSFNSWTAVTIDNHGTVNSTAQTFPYKLPDTTDTSYQLEFRLVDADTHTAYYDPPAAADGIFKYAVTTSTARQLTFDTEVYADAYPSTTTDITLTANPQFTTATDIPVIRKIYQPTIGGVDGALISETEMLAKFPANSTAGTITQTSVAYGAGRVVEYSFDTTHANWPAGNVTSSTGFFRSYYTMAAAAQVSFKHASYGDAYIGTQRNIELDSTVAFVQATAIPITRTVTKGTNAPIVTELTAHFNAGSDKGLLQGDERLVPHVKDATVTFTFGTLPAAWIAAHATKTSTSYNALGYTGQIQDDTQSGGGRGIAVTAESGGTIQIPILLNEDLQAQTSFNMKVQSRLTAAGTSTPVNSAWTVFSFDDHGIVGHKQQYLTYTLPNFVAGDTLVIAVEPVDTDGVDMINSAGGHSDVHYDVSTLPSSYTVSFDAAPSDGYKRYINSTPDITVTVNHPFGVVVDLPVKRYQSVAGGDFVDVSTPDAFVRFEPGQTTGKIIDNAPPTHQDGTTILYWWEGSLPDQDGVSVTRGGNLTISYTMHD